MLRFKVSSMLVRLTSILTSFSHHLVCFLLDFSYKEVHFRCIRQRTPEKTDYTVSEEMQTIANRTPCKVNCKNEQRLLSGNYQLIRIRNYFITSKKRSPNRFNFDVQLVASDRQRRPNPLHTKVTSSCVRTSLADANDAGRTSKNNNSTHD